MTAEIAILNRQGVALAADSAVTIGRERVWKTTNKLFSLAPFNDIGIMAYGAGDFIGYPWETLVKTFRLHVGSRRFATVKDCAAELMDYLGSHALSLQSEERVSILVLFINRLDTFKKSLGAYTSKADFRDKIKALLRLDIDALEKTGSNSANIDEQTFLSTYAVVIHDLAKDSFKEHLTKEISFLLNRAMFELFTRQSASTYETGLVVAGFGSTEFFPSLVTNIVDGKDCGHLRSWTDQNKSHNMNDIDVEPAVVIPFGQSDISALFLEGISGQHLRWLTKTLKVLLDDKSDSIIDAYVVPASRQVERALQRKENSKVVRELSSEFERYRDKSLVQPVMRVLTTLPKEEMAAMAEALVEITSLRRRVDSPLETVGGPTDVAVISKGDGLVWLKRKHYFDGGLNRDFARRKDLQTGRVGDG